MSKIKLKLNPALLGVITSLSLVGFGSTAPCPNQICTGSADCPIPEAIPVCEHAFPETACHALWSATVITKQETYMVCEEMNNATCLIDPGLPLKCPGREVYCVWSDGTCEETEEGIDGVAECTP